ncbi:MAG: hypothetical protein AAF213_08510 [Pseudomonadota bacterium]
MFARSTRQFNLAHQSDLPALEVLGFSLGVEHSRDGALNTSLANIGTLAQEHVRKAQDALAHSPVAKDPEVARFLKATIRDLRPRPWPLPARDSTKTMTTLAQYRQRQEGNARRLVERHFQPGPSTINTAEGVIVQAQVVAKAGLDI